MQINTKRAVGREREWEEEEASECVCARVKEKELVKAGSRPARRMMRALIYFDLIKVKACIL